MLFKCLREHPSISGFENTGVYEDEGQHLQDVYPPAKAFGGFGKFGFNKECYLDNNSALVSEANREKLYKQWSRYWNLEKPVLLEKSPPNLIRTRFLQALFPDSSFIVILRHPIAVSYATRKKTDAETRSLLDHWLICHEQFERDSRYLHNIKILKYESFVSNSQQVLNDIFAFLGLPAFTGSVVVRGNENSRYFEKWKLKEDSSKFEDLESRFRHFGYSLFDLELYEPYSVR